MAPAELASYCLSALAAASTMPSADAVRRLVTVTRAGLRPPRNLRRSRSTCDDEAAVGRRSRPPPWELKNLGGISDVTVDLVPGGPSAVTVTSDEPLAGHQVASALDYQLAGG